MNRKGISPLIAAVLLIAFTMAVASIFAQWAPQLIQDAQGDTSQRAQDIQRCSDAVTEIVQQSATSATVQQKTGDSAIGNITVTWFYQNNPPIQNDTQSIDSNRGAIEVTNTGGSGQTITKIEVDPTSCEGAPTATYEAN